MPTVRNYGRNLAFTPASVARPASVDELVAVVRAARNVRAVGAAHSWSPAIVTDGTLVALDRLRLPLSLDRERMQVTVQGGMRLRELSAYLARHELALANLGSIDAQTVAGVIATGTHGTGRAFRCISAQVARLSFVDGRGERVTLARGDAEFAGAVVALGALGVTYEVTFDVVPAFRLHDITAALPFDEVLERIDELMAAHDHFKVWWAVPCDDVITFAFRRTQAAERGRLRSFLRDRVLSVAVYRALLAVGHLTRRRSIPAINRLLTAQAGRPLERVTRSHRGFLTPSPPVHREAEWAFDLGRARELLPAYRALLLGGGHRYNFIQEVRCSAADDLWLSPAYGRDTLWLSLYNIDRRGWPEQLARFEAFAREHGGRPHWGKEATFDHAYLSASYPRLADFAQLVARHDPERKLRNPFLDSILGAER